MSLPVLQPLVVDGVPAPERDRRWVLAATMAAYEGCHPTTIWRRTLAGCYPANGLKRVGATVRYQPAICLAVQS